MRGGTREEGGGMGLGEGGQDEGMSEYWTGAVGGAPGGYCTTRSLAFTERRSQPSSSIFIEPLELGSPAGPAE